jgi:predicted DNA-binding transcriptional regulator AlpA
MTAGFLKSLTVAGPVCGGNGSSEAELPPHDASSLQAGPLPLLIDARYMAALLQCSVRHVQQLNRRGLLPPPVKLGDLVRWRRGEIEAWVSAGCPARDEWLTLSER